MQKINIREIIANSVDFMKVHYEHLLPFSFLFLVLYLLMSFLKGGIGLMVLVLVLPLTVSIPYYAQKMEAGEPKKIGALFEVYSSFFRFYGVSIVKGFIFLIMLSPLMYVMSDIMAEYQFDEEKLKLAILRKEFIPTVQQSLTSFACFVLVLFAYPFLLFAEFFAVLDDRNVRQSFLDSIDMGRRYYFSLFILMIAQVVVLSIVSLLTCGFMFIVAFPFFNLLFYYIFKEYKWRYKEQLFS